MKRFSKAIFTITLCCSVLTYAAPKIEADKTTIDCGTITEGKTDKINAAFTIRNTGDTPLKIENVRPGCGCTVVKFDTLVPMGKSSIIQSTVNIANFHSGPISKYITVSSNASNKPSLQLTITAKINPIIDVSEQSITLAPQKPVTLILACVKKDLRVTEVVINAQQTGASNGPAWQTKTPLSVPFKWTATDSTRADGLRVFKLELTAPAVPQQLSGQFVIKTNHPDKQEISLSGTVEK
jgi:hypothetical protein